MNTIIAVELHGFQVSKSMKIQYKSRDLFLYPKEYFKNIDDIDVITQEVKKSSNDNNVMQLNNFIRFDVGNGKFTYLICEFPIRVFSKVEFLLKKVEQYFDLFIRLNSFIFDFFISLSNITIFKKEIYEYQLLRCIKFDIILDKNKDYVNIFKLEKYEERMTQLVKRIQDSELFTELVQPFYGFVAAKTEPELEKRISFLWNFLEYLTNIYSSKIGRNLLIDNDNYLKLKKNIEDIIVKNLETHPLIPLNVEQLSNEIAALLNRLNPKTSILLELKEWRNLMKEIRCQIRKTIDESDIMIENYNKNKIQELLIQKLNNFPPIKDLINLMCEDIHYNLNPYEKSIVDRLYIIRNYLFHTSIRLTGLYEKFELDPEIEHYDFQYLKNDVSAFEKIIQKVVVRLFYSSLFEDKKLTNEKKEYFFSISLENEETAKEHFFNVLKKIKNEYTQHEKYANLIKLMLDSEKNFYNKFLLNHPFNGCCIGVREKIIIPFQLQFDNIFSGRGEFNGQISYPEIYNFYIDLRKQVDKLNVLLKFKARIYISFTSKIKNVYIRALDCCNYNN